MLKIDTKCLFWKYKKVSNWTTKLLLSAAAIKMKFVAKKELGTEYLPQKTGKVKSKSESKSKSERCGKFFYTFPTFGFEAASCSGNCLCMHCALFCTQCIYALFSSKGRIENAVWLFPLIEGSTASHRIASHRFQGKQEKPTQLKTIKNLPPSLPIISLFLTKN